jgi:glycosyltransferase involved in cell wall biosynthesis
MKQYCVISCPIDTYSGYGARARDFVKALYESKKEEYDIEIISQRWGVTPWGYIKDHEQEWGFLESMIMKQQMTKQPDVWIQITVPNEFQAVGKFNIGVTAGIETTLCHATWIDGVNRMNLTLTSSEHAKNVFKQSTFEEKNGQGQVVRQIKLEKPVEVLFEGVDLNKYFYVADDDLDGTELVQALDEIKEDFCYLFVGHWLQGDLGEDRKNVALTIKTFLETFKDKKSKPALILKTSGAGSCIMDRDEMLKKIDAIRNTVSGSLPNIYLLHGEMDDKDINNLYNHGKVKAMISLTKGEGFGRPLLEFTLSKKPLIVTAWSGHIDYLYMENTCMVGGTLKGVHPSAQVKDMILPESAWFSPDTKQAEFYLKDIFEKYSKYEERAKKQAHQSKTKFSFDEMKKALEAVFNKIPKSVGLTLPKLKKIEVKNDK